MNKHINNIQECVEDYFRGTYEGNIARIHNAFHADCTITGFIHEEYVEMTLTQFCERISEAAKTAPGKYDKKIVSIDLHDNIATIKARVLVGELYFADYITLLRFNDKWKIRQKSFTTSQHEFL